MKISLCLFVKNEKFGLLKDLNFIKSLGFYEVFAVDAGSVDGSRQILDDNKILVIKQHRKGYNQAYLVALEYFSGDAIIFFHPKGSISADNIKILADFLNQGNDLVIASRMLKTSYNEEDEKIFKPRKKFGELLSILAWNKWNNNANFHFRITDPLHGFRGFSKNFASTLNIIPEGSTADLGIVRHCYKFNYKFHEFAVEEKSREYGKTNFPAIKTGLPLLYFLARR